MLMLKASEAEKKLEYNLHLWKKQNFLNVAVKKKNHF